MLHTKRFSYPGALLLRSRQWSAGPEPVSLRSFSIKDFLSNSHWIHLHTKTQPSQGCLLHTYAPESSGYHHWRIFTQIYNCFRIESFWKTVKRKREKLFKRLCGILWRKCLNRERELLEKVYTHLMYFSSFPNCNGTEQKFSVWEPSELITITIHNWEANAWKIALHHISF